MHKSPVFFEGNRRAKLLSLTIATLASGLLVPIAAAHAEMARSVPADGAVLEESPETVMVWLTEEVESGPSTLQVLNADGRLVDHGDGGVNLNDPDHASMVVSLPPMLPDGTYTVRWSTVSAEDGDSAEGQFLFSVGEAVATSQDEAAPEQSVGGDGIRWPVWLATILAIGLALTVGLALRSRSKRI